jgi:thioredoxin:protein disulfide reductase
MHRNFILKIWLVIFTVAAIIMGQGSVAESSNFSISLDSQELFHKFEEALLHGDILWSLLLALLAGLLTSLSPCVYPLIPITLSVMGARQYDSHFQGFIVSLAYVLGMSLIYTVLGAMFASVGILLGSLMQHPVMLLIVSAIFLVLALIMLGAGNVVVPVSIMNYFSKVGGQGKKSAFLMGLVAGVLAAPCTGPIIAFILMLIAKGKDVSLGSMLMLMFSIGMGIPFLVLGTFSSAIVRIPKSGPWMDFVKRLFGAAMLAAAVYYLSLVIFPLADFLEDIREWGWIAILFVSLGGIILLFLPVYIKRQLPRIIAITLGASLPAFSIAAFLSDDYNNNLLTAQDDQIVWHIIDEKTHDNKMLDKLLLEAKDLKKPVMIDFYADWCSACRRLEAITFKDPKLVPILEKMTLIRVDATRSSDYISLLQDRFQIIGLPTVVFLDAEGHPIDDIKIVGFINALELGKRLEKIK